MEALVEETVIVNRIVLSLRRIKDLFIYLFIWNTLSKQRHPPRGGASNTTQQSYKIIKKDQNLMVLVVQLNNT